jgi:hypothetical protein
MARSTSSLEVCVEDAQSSKLQLPSTIWVQPFPTPYAQLCFHETRGISVVLVGMQQATSYPLGKANKGVQPDQLPSSPRSDSSTCSGWSSGSTHSESWCSDGHEPSSPRQQLFWLDMEWLAEDSYDDTQTGLLQEVTNCKHVDDCPTTCSRLFWPLTICARQRIRSRRCIHDARSGRASDTNGSYLYNYSSLGL